VPASRARLAATTAAAGSVLGDGMRVLLRNS
jgi:hypothetical protein